MTKFDRSKFDLGYGEERYVTYEGKFVGRFKYARAAQNARHFVDFLARHFTVEEYFEKLKTMAPLAILEQKGYVNYNTRLAMKRGHHKTRQELLDAMKKSYGLA